jgi:hypothetical protein
MPSFGVHFALVHRAASKGGHSFLAIVQSRMVPSSGCERKSSSPKGSRRDRGLVQKQPCEIHSVQSFISRYTKIRILPFRVELWETELGSCFSCARLIDNKIVRHMSHETSRIEWYWTTPWSSIKTGQDR